MGFLYPIVDESKCVNCGLCESVCSFHDHYDTSLNFLRPEAFAVRHKDVNEVATSRSGAAFIAISDWILDQGGVVYGVGYTDHFRVVHKRAITKEERNEFKGSKYVQSDLSSTFRLVKRDLQNGKLVLFSGTPCQTSGLNSFIGKRLRSNLYLVDIVCHGVPAPYIWRDYLAYIEKKEADSVVKINFRDKSLFGWSAHKESFTFLKKGLRTYPYTFYNSIIFRQSCNVCYFANIQRPSDITIGDFWGWEKVAPEMNKDDKGLSLVFINTENGRLLFNSVRQVLNLIEVKLDDCIQPNLERPTLSHTQRESYENDYSKHGFLYVSQKYGDMGWKYNIKVLRRKMSTAKNIFLKRIKR